MPVLTARPAARALAWRAAAFAVLGALARPLPGQSAGNLRAGVAPQPPAAHVTAPSGAPSPFTPLASFVLPGAAQYMLHDDRSIAYGATEVIGWFLYFKNNNDRQRQESAFKNLARQVARAHFSTSFPDAPWAYYEQMRDWLESGAYSQSDAALVPETDTLTYNGYKWQLALRTTPTREAALAQYQQVAIKPDFEWSWRNAQEQWDLFKRTTESRNDANRAAIHALALISANHIVSMIDAFSTIRLSVEPATNGGARIGASVRW